MPNWRYVWIVCLQDPNDSQRDKRIITNCGSAYSRHYGIPEIRRFTNLDGEPRGFQTLQAGCLAEANQSDKLFVVGHGSSGTNQDGETAGLGPRSGGVAGTAGFMVSILQDCGLQHIGFVSFKACHLGYGSFHDHFATYCDRAGIHVGCVKGYRGPAATIGGSLLPTELVTSRSSNWFKKNLTFKTGSSRYKIVAGSAYSTFPFRNSGRFDGRVYQELDDEFGD